MRSRAEKSIRILEAEQDTVSRGEQETSALTDELLNLLKWK